MSDSDTDSSDTDEFKSPPKTKRRYKRSIHHGPSVKSARYHNINSSLKLQQQQNSSALTSTESLGTTALVSSSDVSELNDYVQENDVSECDSYHGYSSEREEVSENETSINLSTSSISSDSTSEFEIGDFSDNSNNEEFDLGDGPLFEGCQLSPKSSYTMVMLFVSRFKLPNDGFTQLLNIIKSHLPVGCQYPTSTYKVKENLKKYMDFAEPKLHAFCEKCQQILTDGNACTNEVCLRQHSKIQNIFDLHLIDQLANMFQDIHFLRAIEKQKERLATANTICDITKGLRYKQIMNAVEQNGADINLTFTLNTDGVSLFTSSKSGSLWPVYVAINELPIKLRFSRKYMIPCYLHCETEKPCMLSYLTPMMEALKTLYEPGIKVTVPSGKTLMVKAHLIAVSVDLPAKALVLNMKQFNARCACSVCLDEGKSPPGFPMLRYFPYQEQSDHRTQRQMLIDAKEAMDSGEAVHGVKGASALMKLKYLDLPTAFVVDWMHCVLLGVTKALLVFWLNSKHKEKEFYIGDKIALLNKRFLDIQIPDFIARRQRSLADHSHWKATEYREWLIHFSSPVLYGILNATTHQHYLLFVTAMSILTRDDLEIEAVDEAEHLLKDFCKIFPLIYGERSQTMNLHLLKHLPEFVKMYGPLYGYSCFGFESMNSYLKNMVHGTRHINKQISFAVGLSKKLGPLVKEIIDSDLNREIRGLFLELSSKLVLDENYADNQENYSALGKIRVLQANDDLVPLIQAQGIPHNNVKTFARLKSSGNTFYCQRHQTAKTRKDSVVSFRENRCNGISFGTVLLFLECNNEKFAVVQKYEVKPFKLERNEHNEETIQHLRKYINKPMCPHIMEKIRCQGKIVLPVENLLKKCVWIEIDSKRSFISCPPNLLEHN